MTAEFQAALARFDDDVRLVCEATAKGDRRQHIVTAYREALTTAAGVPDDARWTALIVDVDELVRQADCVRDRAAAAALARLAGFVAENGEQLPRDDDRMATV